MSEYSDTAAGAASAALASKVTYGGAGMSITGYFLSSEFAVLSGLVIGLAGLAVNVYFKRREDHRQQAEHDARMGLYE